MNLFSTLFFSLMLVGTHQSNLSEFTEGNNQFTASIYKELLIDETENIIVSPLSAQIVLALVQFGAKGKTAEELQQCLHLPSSEDLTKSSFKTLFNSLKKDDLYKLYIANKIYVKNGLSIKTNFKKLANDIFHADLENIDFSQSKKAANVINTWVEQQTKNKIQNLIDPKILGPTTSLILVNTLYFKIKWQSTFEQEFTKKRKFYKTAKDEIEVDGMIMQSSDLGYYEDKELKAKFLKKDFQNNKFSMILVLPNEKEGLKDIENKAEKVFVSHPFQETLVVLMLPKFKIETKTMFSKILKKLGVSKAFSKNEADFSGIIDESDSLVISEIVQKAFIEVNEDGIEVAVATNLEMLVGSSPFEEKPKEFIADHPFMYYIKFEDVVLFAGRVSAPKY